MVETVTDALKLALNGIYARIKGNNHIVYIGEAFFENNAVYWKAVDITRNAYGRLRISDLSSLVIIDPLNEQFSEEEWSDIDYLNDTQTKINVPRNICSS